MPASERSILLTGDRGLIGRWLRRALVGDGWNVIGFDRRDGLDVTRPESLGLAAERAAVTIHCAVLPHDSHEDRDAMWRINAIGTENVLAAAERARHRRVIAFSSAQVFGIFDGERAPTEFPIGDDAPRLAARPYGSSKVAAEDACETFTERSGIPSLCLRPVHVWVPGQAADTYRRWRREPSREFEPHWNFGGWVDVRDVVSAVRLALSSDFVGHERALLSAADAAATRPTLEMTSRFFPSVPWAAERQFGGEDRSSLFDCSVAKGLLGWGPRHTWAASSLETALDRVARRLRQPFPP